MRNEDDGDSEMSVSEVLFCQFLADHYLPPLVADHLGDLVILDSKIAKLLKCKCTKTTQIVKGALAPTYTKVVIGRCRSGPFSLAIDESNDRNEEEHLAVLVRLFQGNWFKSRILDIPVLCLCVCETVCGGVCEYV